MGADSQQNLPKRQTATVLKKLLGSLELEVMELMWEVGDATVQLVTSAINRRRPIAYTTVMTVMGHLVDKGLLTRDREGKRYQYRVARSRDEFLRDTSRRMVREVVNDFGGLAVAQILGEIEYADADSLRRLRDLVQRTGGGSNASE